MIPCTLASIACGGRQGLDKKPANEGELPRLDQRAESLAVAVGGGGGGGQFT
ncbi:uncharacterized protein GLRG_07871 [Colletotrichum graminicola M1.001]|uniref:Uncharacterized protein n=1 Tax=Colletotrichum graminicola (strain M1.001 / M2 / FGSC 10212) TaxID=645133 RepID=E3QPD9_COLGM|nr:uncharacterized protein GLRG_07871 [Colletotrichum graminicola M1.001]EFQ32727.1 hypothetical protein GLRG_07871 [Colletotrichum graminicola M1.001]